MGLLPALRVTKFRVIQFVEWDLMNGHIDLSAFNQRYSSLLL